MLTASKEPRSSYSSINARCFIFRSTAAYMCADWVRERRCDFYLEVLIRSMYVKTVLVLVMPRTGTALTVYAICTAIIQKAVYLIPRYTQVLRCPLPSNFRRYQIVRDLT